MTEQGVRWTADQVLALAPDAASRKAGGKLGMAGPWSGTGCSGEGAVWGLCRGSGGASYRTVVDVADAAGPASNCSCPSRKFPCKHTLGLLLLWAGGDVAVVVTGAGPKAEAEAEEQIPDWAGKWLAGRRERAEHRRAGGSAGPSAADPSTGGGNEAARRRAERRAERITAGVTELEQRLADLLRSGLASAEQDGYALWEETAARMVDAQAPGLASRTRELGAITGSGPGWPVRLLEECALLHLLDRGWLRRDRLPEGLAATVRSRVGLPATAEDPPVHDRWLVLAQYDTADSRLTTRRIWLYGITSGRTALLLSYGAAGRAPELTLPVGLTLEGELSWYPGSGQQRAAVTGQLADPAATDEIRPPGTDVAEAAARYGTALRDDPWLDSVPVTLDQVVPVPDGDGWQLADAGTDLALPLSATARSRPGLWRLLALSGGTPVTVFGECGHHGFTPLAAWPQGPGRGVTLC